MINYDEFLRFHSTSERMLILCTSYKVLGHTGCDEFEQLNLVGIGARIHKRVMPEGAPYPTTMKPSER